jgi:hypothetical protein
MVFWSGMVAHNCNPSFWKAETGGSQVQGQPGLHSETLSQNNNNKKDVLELVMVMHVCNPSTWYAEAEGSLLSLRPDWTT